MNLHKLEERKYQLGAAGQELTQLCSPHPTSAVSATVPIPITKPGGSLSRTQGFQDHTS